MKENTNNSTIELTYADFAKLMREVINLCKFIDDVEYGRNPANEYYERNLKRLKEIGSILNKENGFDSMFEMAQLSSQWYSNCRNTLHVHWHGIGKWQR